MFLIPRTFLFTVLIGFSGVLSAEAKTLRCEAIFQPSLQEMLEKMDRENSQFLLQGKSVDQYSQTLSWSRKRKVRQLIKNLDLNDLASEKVVERQAVELSTALFGSKDVVDRWLFKSREQRLEESTLLIIKEQLIKEGLLKTWGEVYNPAKRGTLKKILDRVWNLQNSRGGEWLRMPFMLPSLKNKEISAELMQKIIQDGFNAHAEEARIALGQQSKIEAYNTFRKIYAPVFFGVLLIAQVQHAYLDLQAAMDEQVQHTLEQLRDQRQSLEKNIPLLKQEELQKAYASAVAEFTQKWGEPPTPEESAQLRTKIEKALKI